MTFDEKRELKELEKELTKLEIQKKAIEDDFKKEIDYEKLMPLGVELDNIIILTEAQELVWLELRGLDTL